MFLRITYSKRVLKFRLQYEQFVAWFSPVVIIKQAAC